MAHFKLVVCFFFFFFPSFSRGVKHRTMRTDAFPWRFMSGGAKGMRHMSFANCPLGPALLGLCSESGWGRGLHRAAAPRSGCTVCLQQPSLPVAQTSLHPARSQRSLKQGKLGLSLLFIFLKQNSRMACKICHWKVITGDWFKVWYPVMPSETLGMFLNNQIQRVFLCKWANLSFWMIFKFAF